MDKKGKWYTIHAMHPQQKQEGQSLIPSSVFVLLFQLAF